MIKVKLSKDAGAQPQQGQAPSFSSWGAPSAAAKAPELKPLSGDTLARKSKGQSVKDLQNHLNQGAKNKLEVDGRTADREGRAQVSEAAQSDGRTARWGPKPWPLSTRD